MKYIGEPNMLLEALAWLGRKAAGRSVGDLEDRLTARGIRPTKDFRERLAPLTALSRHLHAPDQETLKHLFGNLQGFAYNVIGLYSVGFLLFYPMIWEYKGDFDALLAKMESLSPDQVARNIMLTLGLRDHLPTEENGCSALLVEHVLQMGIPPESCVAILNAHREYKTLLPEVAGELRPILNELESQRPAMKKLAEAFGEELMEIGCGEYIRSTSALEYNEGYRLHPLLLAPDTNLSLEPEADGVTTDVYCGVLRHIIQKLLSTADDLEAQVFEIMNLLGDRTRYNIMCYISRQPSYGQELSNHFGIARNTVNFHMNKLVDAGLVNSSATGNRVYYSIDQQHLDWWISQFRKLMLSGRYTSMLN